MATDIDLFDGHLSPGEVIRLLLDRKGWSQDQFAAITGRSRQTIIQIMGGKAGITPETAVVFAAALGNSAGDWLRLESMWRLSRISSETTAVEHRMKIYGRLPIKEIQKRGWIAEVSSLEDLESEIKKFLGVQSLDDPAPFLVATRRSTTAELTPPQLAWCARARQLASALIVASKFDPAKLKHAERDLRELAAYPKEARHLSDALSRYGIRFVVIEPLQGAKIDGAALWLDSRSPVIAVSIRFDRIDAFWFTVLHEFWHIAHGDALSVDVEMLDLLRGPTASDDTEERANRDAAATLIPPAELESFVRRVGPYYSRDRVIQFAHKIKMHPAIIVGQLQHRGEIGYSALRDLLSKVRDVVTGTAVTDGWGKSLAPNML